MNIEAPTFNALNKPQKRALILRDQLRFLDPHHLDSFLEGVSDNEPPTYTRTNGVIKPELALVILREEGTYFDLGNVLLSEDKNTVKRVYLLAEKGQVQMHMEDPLPLDDGVLDSLPIHGFIARGMMPLFKEKFQAIQSRMSKINEARRAAYNMAHKMPISVPERETLTRPNPSKIKQIPTASPSKTPMKPKPSHEIKQHISNKRKRTNLEAAPEQSKNRTPDANPEETKSRILDTIPSDIKVSLFNTIVNTAFPHLDNLITASRNVVSMHSMCGSDLAALHRSIVDLKLTLQDFDEAFGKRVERERTTGYRHDFEESSRSGEARNRFVSANTKNADNIPPQSDNDDDDDDDDDGLNGTFTTLQKTKKSKEINKIFGTPIPASLPLPPSSPSNKLEVSSLLSSSPSSSPDSIPHTNPLLPNTHIRNSDSCKAYTSITALHQESVLRFHLNNVSGSPHATDTRGGQTGFLGNSLLGARKTAGGGGGCVAPVVNMLPCVRRKEGEEEKKKKKKKGGGDVGMTGGMEM